jgi:hypothetical protein
MLKYEDGLIRLYRHNLLRMSSLCKNSKHTTANSLSGTNSYCYRKLVTLEKLEQFLPFYRAKQQKKDGKIRPVSPVKIALIDTGVNKSSVSQVRKGVSYVHNSKRESPWWLAIHPHGTQMANLICQIDSYCELYIAKAGESKPTFLGAVQVRVFILCSKSNC